MARTYTLIEAAHAFDVDDRTLRRWLDKLKINTDPKKGKLDVQTAIHDERIRLLSEEQMQQIAKTMQRPWPPVIRMGEQAKRQEQAKGLHAAMGRQGDE